MHGTLAIAGDQPHSRRRHAVPRQRKGVFEDVTSQYGLATPTFGFTGFGTQWLDYDNDGRLDLFIANGAVTIVESLARPTVPVRSAQPAVSQ